MRTKLHIYGFLFLLVSSYIFGQNNFYLGVYSPNSTPSCATCHSTLVPSWEQTGHAIAQDSLVSNPNFGYDCLGCHNTGWDLAVTNNGADEHVIRDDNQTPNYVITNQTQWDLVKNVQCESCHGPVGTAQGGLDFGHTSRTTDFGAMVCGVCHEGSHHPYMSEWEQSAHAEGIPPFFSRANNGDCYYCHAAQDFIAFLEDPNYNGTTFQPEGGVDEVITCVTCHDPHGNDNPGNLRVAVSSNDVICDVCHTVHTDVVNVDDTPHHTTSECLSGSPNFGYQYPNSTYQNSPHTFVATERCINCHVHMTPFNYATGAAAVTGHTFEPRIQSCAEAGCHGENYYTLVDTSDAEKKFDLYGAQTEIKGLLATLQTRLDDASSSDSLTQEFKQARYNYLAADAEGSYGIHNTKLVRGLLQDAIANFTPVGVEDKEAMPTVYELSQNYPNPFNPSTTIKFSVPETANVTITIYDALGKVVSELMNSELAQGTYTVDWNASGYASGLYFYQIKTDNFTSVKKMVLMK